jgi:hypothetical protein
MAHVQFGDSAYYDSLLKAEFVKQYSKNRLDKMLQKIKLCLRREHLACSFQCSGG